MKVLQISKLVLTKKMILTWLKEYSYHFIFFPSPLEVNTAIFSSLNDRPPSSASLHVAVSLPMGHAVSGERRRLWSPSALTETGRLMLTGSLGPIFVVLQEQMVLNWETTNFKMMAKNKQ